MIRNINSQNLDSKFGFQSRMSSGKVSIPVQKTQKNENYTDYSLDNLKANYMPQKTKNVISFKGANEKFNFPITYSSYIDYDDENLVSITNLPTEKKLKGNFYKEFSDDLAVAIRSGENVFLEKEKGVSAEIFVQNFAKNLEDKEAEGKKTLGAKTRVVYIKDPLDLLNQQKANNIFKGKDKPLSSMDPVSYIQDLITGFTNLILNIEEETPEKKVVFIDNFEDMGKIFQSVGESIDVVFNELNLYGPKVSIVALTKKREEKEGGGIKISLGRNNDDEFKIPEDMHKMQLSGLNVKDTNTFLNENPNYLKPILNKYKEAKINITPESISEAVAKSAAIFDEAMPASTSKLLDIAIASKLNDAETNTKELTLNAEDVKNLVNTHSKLVDSMASKKMIEVVNNSNGRMEDLAGLQDAKEKVEDVFDYFKDPKGFLESGRKMPGGFLFTGPPGTGKTEMARIIASEASRRTGKEIPFFELSNFGNTYINSGKMAIDAGYDNARKHCEKIGAEFGIMFIDEGDQICRKIKDGPSSSAEDAKTTDALKIQLDGLKSKTSKVKIFTIINTNHPEVFDDALLRPSRLRQIEFEIPQSNADVLELLKIHSKKKPFANEAAKTELLNEMANIVKGLNGDQMTQILDDATKLALKTDKKIITKQEITTAFITTIIGPRTKSDSSLQDRLTCSIHEAGHAEAHVSLKNINKLMAISNESRGGAGATTFCVPNNAMFETFDSAVEQIASLYGGSEAEKLLNKTHASGVSNDFSKISSIVEYAIKKGSLGIYTPQISFYNTKGVEFTDLSKQYAKEIKKDGEIFTETAQRIIHQLIKGHKNFLLNKYLKENEEAILAGNDGKNYLAQEYIDIRNEWLIKTGEIKAEPVLEDGIEALKNIALTDKFWAKTAKVKNARNIMSDGVEKLIGFSQDRKWLDDESQTAEDLSKKIKELVNFAENGETWLETIGKENIEEKFVASIKEIIESAIKKADPVELVKQPGTIKKLIQRAFSMI